MPHFETNLGIGGHQSARSRTNEWLTPPSLLKKLGKFDLDPCSPLDRPFDTAGTHWTVEDDGLSKEWFGRVYCNPPYGSEAAQWLRRMVKHGNGLALIFARTETEMFFKHIWEAAHGVLFIRGRLTFLRIDGTTLGNGGAPSVLIAYGSKESDFLSTCDVVGKFIKLRGDE